ncbi:F-box/FBD/LRR-repeat protein At4g26340-like isoform X1 [Euphorbia lathyris]|uniref:F-box/FBD/LRR-repeat protein At4g26340-like isoform X1 n=1 Tax=Euphorbia lathyris TaxID=212925 RepID=UPI0033140F1D
MDINLPVTKDQRCSESLDIIEDRISKLPDEILGKILSYLRTKRAVATSVLSKRWEYLWTLTSDLDFCDFGLLDDEAENKNDNDYMIKMRSFQRYVDRVIFYHGGSDIGKCRLDFHSKYAAPSFYALICALITCNVQKLSLDCCRSTSNTYSHLPWMFFSNNTLVELSISGNLVLDLPTYVCFPCLKILFIQFPVFVDDASTARLFSSCPVLEELTIFRLKDDLEIMNISVPSLKRLMVDSGTSSCLQTTINTPCLEYLEIDARSRYFVNFTSSLVHADVEGVDIYLLNAISQVEYLSLTASEMSLQNIIRDSALPIFKNLKTMELRDSVGWRTPANDWKVLPNLLDSSPNLRVLIFCQGLVSLTLYRDDFNHFDWQRPESVPECLSMHLKTIEIFEFVGFPEELQIVEYLLECGKVLEKMIIHRFVLSKSTIMKKKVKRDKVMSELLSLRRNCSTGEVMSFKRSSSSCEVIFTD